MNSTVTQHAGGVPAYGPRRRGAVRRLIVVGGLIAGVLGVIWFVEGGNYLRERRLESLLASGDVDTAAAVSRELTQDMDALSPGVCLLMVRSLRMADDVAAAEQTLDRCEQLINEPTRVSQERALNRARRGQLEGTDSRLAALLRDPQLDERDVCEAFAIGLRLNRRFAEAAQLLEAWQRDWPDDYRPHYHEGLMRQTLTSWQQAIDCYQTALQLNPQSDLCRLRMGECLNQLERGREAVALLAAVTENQPDNAAAWEALATSRRQTGDFAASRSACLQVLSLTPENDAARRCIAEIDLDTGDPQSAVAIAGELLAVWPEDAATLYLQTRALAIVGRADESRELTERWKTADRQVQQIEQDIQVLRERPGDIDLQVSLGERMLQHYSRSMGIQFIGAALQMVPGHEQARRILEEYQQKSRLIGQLPLPPERELP